MENTRPTLTFETTGGNKIVYKTFINKLEEREIAEIYLAAMDEEKTGISSGRAKFKADDRAMELIIVSLNGSTEDIVNKLNNELPTV